jgi:hypothetical protein
MIFMVVGLVLAASGEHDTVLTIRGRLRGVEVPWD